MLKHKEFKKYPNKSENLDMSQIRNVDESSEPVESLNTQCPFRMAIMSVFHSLAL